MKMIFPSLAILPLLAACATVPQSEEVAQTTSAIGAAPSVLESSGAKTTSGTTASGNAIVSAADPRAAEAGAQILRQGGSATDGAIAVMVALTVVETQSSGIGGGGFFVRGTPDGTVETIDGRETAPAAATPNWFLDENGESIGYRNAVMTGLSIGVPGNLKLAEIAHQKYGKLGWADLFEPSIKLARDGFILSERGHEYLVRFKARASRDPNIVPIYFDEAGEPLPAGTRIRNPKLAELLERIAKEGPDALYRGASATALAKTIRDDTPLSARRPAGMDVSDIASYQAKPRPTVCGTYRGYRICGMGPPSSGATTILAILGQLERFDLAALGPDNPTFWHLFTESQRLAYADRERYLADADFISVPTAGLVDPSYLAQRSALISPDARIANASAGLPPGAQTIPPDGNEPPEKGTSHFAVLDRDGNMVSYTSTIEGPFGSGLTFGGFYLNNELTDFSLAPEKEGMLVANRVEGGKRPRSSMAPTVIYRPDGSLFMAVGAAGGGTIPVQTSRAIIAAIDFGLPVEEALAFPMLYSPGNTIALEEGSPVAAMQAPLEAMGHTVVVRRLPLKANAILCRKNTPCTGAGDPRSEGVAVAAD